MVNASWHEIAIAFKDLVDDPTYDVDHVINIWLNAQQVIITKLATNFQSCN